MTSTSLVVSTDKSKQLIGVSSSVDSASGRLSGLSSPVLQLRGHSGALFCCRFSADGALLATAGMDRTIRLWDVFSPSCRNTLTLTGHTGPVLDLCWAPDSASIVSASADRTLALWDAATGSRLRRFTGHRLVVNSVSVPRTWNTDALYDDALLLRPDVASPVFASVSDDATARLWDPRAGARHCATVVYKHSCPLTTCCFGGDGTDTLYVAGLDGAILGLDLRKISSSTATDEEMKDDAAGEEEGEKKGAMATARLTLSGHTDTVTGLSMSKDGSFLLSNAMDKQLRVWDVRPFAPENRCVKILVGHEHSFEKNLLRCAWGSSSRYVTAASSDGMVNVWNTTNRAIVHRLPGHAGSVNDVALHPSQPIIASAGSDGTVFIGEIKL